MLDTAENIKKTEKEWKDRTEKLNITEEEIMSDKYDYLDED